MTMARPSEQSICWPSYTNDANRERTAEVRCCECVPLGVWVTRQGTFRVPDAAQPKEKPMAEVAATSKSFLRLDEVIARVGLSRSQIYRQIASGTFPSHYPLGLRSVGWLSSEIDEWIDARIAARKPTRAFLAKAA